MIRITAIYANDTGSRFDAAYYRDQHTAFAQGLLGPLGLLEVRTVFGAEALDGAPPPFWAVSEMVFDSRQRFDEAMAACGERLFADIPNYTNVVPVLQISRLESAINTPDGA